MSEGSATCDQCGAFVDAVTRPTVEVAPRDGAKRFEQREPPHLEPCGHDSSYTWTLQSRSWPAEGPPPK